MDNEKVPLPHLTLDLDMANSSIHPSTINSLQIPPLLFPPNLFQEYSQLSSLDMEWVNDFLLGPLKFGNNNDPQKPSSVPPDNLSLTSRVRGNIVGGEGDNSNDGSFGAVGSRVVTDNRKLATGRSKKLVPARVAFHTRSADDVLDDGYRWRKYGQKAVKNSSHPRSYYRCTHHTCNVKKQIQRLATDSSIVVTTYEGKHNHPSEKLMETLAPLLKQLQLLTRF